MPERGILGASEEICEGVTAFGWGVVVSEGGRLEGLRRFHRRLDPRLDDEF